jgi:hypothetical protein
VLGENLPVETVPDLAVHPRGQLVERGVAAGLGTH